MAHGGPRRAARSSGVALVLAAAVGACAPALKVAPPLADLAGGGPPPGPEAVAGLLSEAEGQFGTRSIEGVRRAAALYLRVASAQTADAGALLEAVQAEIWLTEHETEPAAREAAATRAVQAAQWCPSLAPGLPDCEYWLGAALGMQARERPTTGLSALPKIEGAFKAAAEAKPEIDEAGPDRALALLYLRAPGWPRGPGDPARGLERARRAVALRPGYPPNRLALAEALAATGDTAGSLAAGREALQLAESRAAAGDPDAPEWVVEARKAIEGGKGKPAPRSG